MGECTRTRPRRTVAVGRLCRLLLRLQAEKSNPIRSSRRVVLCVYGSVCGRREKPVVGSGHAKCSSVDGKCISSHVCCTPRSTTCGRSAVKFQEKKKETSNLKHWRSHVSALPRVPSPHNKREGVINTAICLILITHSSPRSSLHHHATHARPLASLHAIFASRIHVSAPLPAFAGSCTSYNADRGLV
jgi:hypothetical protein